MNLIDTFIRDDRIVPPEELIHFLMAHTGLRYPQCRIFLVVYFQSLKIALKTKEKICVMGWGINYSSKEPHRIKSL